jgi:hypothetical protein
MADAIKQLSRFCEIHAVELRRMNQLKHEEIQRKALRLVEKGETQPPLRGNKIVSFHKLPFIRC